jgi:hypothetical protein
VRRQGFSVNRAATPRVRRWYCDLGIVAEKIKVDPREKGYISRG